MLSDPQDGTVHYVGKTIQPLSRRLSQHTASARNGRRWASAIWVRALLAAGREPCIHLLETVPVGLWEDAERGWIAKMASAGHPLKNASEGGDGPNGYHHTDEARAKISAAGMGRRHSPETIAKLKARTYDPGWGARVSAAKKGKVVISEQQKAEIAASLRKYFADPANRQKSREAKLRKPSAQTAEVREKRSISLRKYHADRAALAAEGFCE